ncbi:helix-turn-helix domain-containing protein [Anaeromyxobacter paludicola]|uniref:HTH cro/C1-type domain-containing protein n=1 Tax=Anaeromyxobacter paludicola TaxID=2918171 RepID=A0ABM7X8P9_9BACT|nr:helix-turn-helix transcriptional regulator [Anaeromyxobacter paludicola]BDG08219.1 hypothetical protein AMPC_13320 [Anaeromyxobacter paludicola]
MVGAPVLTYLQFIGSNVQRLRARKGLTQEKMAEAADLDVRFLRRVERGSVMLRFDTFVRLAVALDVEPGVLLRRVKVAPAKPGRPRRPRPTTR